MIELSNLIFHDPADNNLQLAASVGFYYAGNREMAFVSGLTSAMLMWLERKGWSMAFKAWFSPESSNYSQLALLTEMALGTAEPLGGTALRELALDLQEGRAEVITSLAHDKQKSHEVLRSRELR